MKTPHNSKRQSLTTVSRGALAEQQASQYLKNRGLQLLSRNYRCKCGEIDLVMQHENCIVFVEVRYRKNSAFGNAAESIDWRKQKKLIATAQHYLQSHKMAARFTSRIDVVAITGKNHIEWIQNAI